MDPPYAEGTIEGIGGADTEWGRIGMLICADTFGDTTLRGFEPSSPISS
jgi:hypothetical protein